MTRFYPVETSTLYSPAWFVPFDEFAQRVRSSGIAVALDRFDVADNAWIPRDTQPIRTPSAAIAYPELGRRRGAGAEPERFRVRFSGLGYQPLYPADGEPFDASVLGIEFFAYPYDDTNPPAVTSEPRLVRLLPSASFPYGPGVRTVYGVVVDATTQAPVANALVVAEGTTVKDGAPWLERTLTDPRGNFRLSLRWEGDPQPRPPGPPGPTPRQIFHLTATERPGRTGSLDVRFPADRDRRLVIEISDDPPSDDPTSDDSPGDDPTSGSDQQRAQ